MVIYNYWIVICLVGGNWRGVGYIYVCRWLTLDSINYSNCELNTMSISTLLIVSFLVLLGGALGHPLHKRYNSCSNTNIPATVNLVCQSLWYLEGTIAHCPNRSACNQTALNGIKSAIQSDLCSWVSICLQRFS